MRHIYPFPELGSATLNEKEIVGTTQGVESCTISVSRFGAGANQVVESSAHDRFYFCLSGTLDISAGELNQKLVQYDLAFVPAGLSLKLSSAGLEDATCLTIVVPVEGAASPAPLASVTRLELGGFQPHLNAKRDAIIEGFGIQKLASRDTGSGFADINVARVEPRSGGPRLHLHPFDQFYIVLSGTLDLQVGLKEISAPTNSVVMLPEGLVHANWNNSDAAEMHLVVMTPSKQHDERGSFPVEITGT